MMSSVNGPGDSNLSRKLLLGRVATASVARATSVALAGRPGHLAWPAAMTRSTAGVRVISTRGYVVGIPQVYHQYDGW